ncbi:hypothetical protein SEVIR_5G266751v4 [Setaria viridis]
MREREKVRTPRSLPVASRGKFHGRVYPGPHTLNLSRDSAGAAAPLLSQLCLPVPAPHLPYGSRARFTVPPPSATRKQERKEATKRRDRAAAARTWPQQGAVAHGGGAASGRPPNASVAAAHRTKYAMCAAASTAFGRDRSGAQRTRC